MTKKLPLARPGLTAIAAVLALSSTGLAAQTAPTEGASPPVVQVTPPTVLAPPPVVPEASTPIAAPIEMETVAPPTVATPQPTRAPAARNTATTRPAVTSRAATPRSAPVAAAPVAAITETASPLPVEDAVTADVSDLTAAPIAAAAPAPAEASGTGNNADWTLIGGGAAALLLIGGVGLAFARRRRTADAYMTGEPVVTTVPQTEPLTPAATVADVPSYIRDERTYADAAANPVATAIAAGAGRHEALALMGPTRDNPFLTRHHRLKRARFYDRRERLASEADRAARHADSVWAQPAAVRAQAGNWMQREPQRVQMPHPGGIGTFKPGFAKG